MASPSPSSLPPSSLPPTTTSPPPSLPPPPSPSPPPTSPISQSTPHYVSTPSLATDVGAPTSSSVGKSKNKKGKARLQQSGAYLYEKLRSQQALRLKRVPNALYRTLEIGTRANFNSRPKAVRLNKTEHKKREGTGTEKSRASITMPLMEYEETITALQSVAWDCYTHPCVTPYSEPKLTTVLTRD